MPLLQKQSCLPRVKFCSLHYSQLGNANDFSYPVACIAPSSTWNVNRQGRSFQFGSSLVSTCLVSQMCCVLNQEGLANKFRLITKSRGNSLYCFAVYELFLSEKYLTLDFLFDNSFFFWFWEEHNSPVQGDFI